MCLWISTTVTHTHTPHTQQYSPCSCSPLKTLDWFAVRYCCWFCVLRALKRSWGAASFALFVFVSVFCFCSPNQRPPGSRRDAQTDRRAGKRCAYRRLHSSTSSASASASSSSSFSCLFSFSASQMWFIKFSKTHFPPPFKRKSNYLFSLNLCKFLFRRKYTKNIFSVVFIKQKAENSKNVQAENLILLHEIVLHFSFFKQRIFHTQDVDSNGKRLT